MQSIKLLFLTFLVLYDALTSRLRSFCTHANFFSTQHHVASQLANSCANHQDFRLACCRKHPPPPWPPRVWYFQQPITVRYETSSPAERINKHPTPRCWLLSLTAFLDQCQEAVSAVGGGEGGRGCCCPLNHTVSDAECLP